jgi:AcrR family transcriptional regulator
VAKVNANDPRVRRTRKLLQRALLDLMAEKSFRAITVQDLAERSTVNRATFYAHFRDKYDLANSIVRTGLKETIEAQVPGGPVLTTDALRALCRIVFEYMAQMRGHCAPGDQEMDQTFDRAVQEVVQAFLAGRLGRLPPVGAPGYADRDALATMASWTIFGAGLQWSRGPRRQTADDLAEQLVAALAAGLTPALATVTRERRQG